MKDKIKKILKRIIVFILAVILLFLVINLPKIYTYTKAIGIYGPKDFIGKNADYFDTKEKRAAWWYYLDEEWKECLVTNSFIYGENSNSAFAYFAYLIKPTFCISDNQIIDILTLKKFEGIKHYPFFPTGPYEMERINKTDIFENLTNIEYLDYRYSSIFELGNITKLTKLKKLIVSKTNISNLNGLDSLKLLEYLDCSFNNLIVPPSVSELKNLDTLIIYRNNFDSDDRKIKALIKQIQVKTLVVTENEHYNFFKNN